MEEFNKPWNFRFSFPFLMGEDLNFRGKDIVMQIYCFSPFGYEGSLVSVEVDLRRGIPAVDIVGLADGAIKESRERMKSAIRNSGYEFPPDRVLISLAPADLKKEGAGFDLAVALAVLVASDENVKVLDGPVLVLGELELNGKVRAVRGIHAAISTAKAGGISYCIVPRANAQEAREIEGMKVFGADSLVEAYTALSMDKFFTEKACHKDSVQVPAGFVDVAGVLFPKEDSDFNYAEIRNQDFYVRALQIAAAGSHNMLAFGPPGCGKTLAMQRFYLLCPCLTMEEAQSVTRIYSIAGLLDPNLPVIRRRPFRQPHQTASIEGMCGGGPHCTPGEISLAHNGVLFLDEAAEFKTSVLQMLRVPLECGSITLSRAGRSTVFPANFQLMMATNPCPCGYYGSLDKLCLCSARSVEQYWKKFSGPLLDRLDIRVQVARNTGICERNGKSTAELRIEIARAELMQKRRQGKKNSRLTPLEIAEYCVCTQKAKDVLDKASAKYGFSPRGVSGCLKVSRTIADMKELDIIDEESMKEAVSYRRSENDITGYLS